MRLLRSSSSLGLGLTPSLLVCALLPLVGCDGTAGDDTPEPPPAPPPGTSASSSFVATEWCDLLYTAIRTEALSPPVASRLIGYAGVTLYESVVPGMPGNRSLGRQLNGLGELPAAPSDAVDWPTAANAALAEVLSGLLATASAPTLTAIDALEDDLDALRAADVAAEIMTRSQTFGTSIGVAILDWAGTDGFTQWNNCTYVVPTGPGLWVPTPPAFAASPLQPCWGNMRPFAMLFASECMPLPFPAYSTVAGSPFAIEAQEVYDTVNSLSPEELEIALFWADNPGQTGTPPGHWVSILSQVCIAEEIDLALAAEASAKLGIALADSFISCWEMKYAYNLLRPISYIRDLAGPIADAAWVTPTGINTPPFPEFTSGHSVQSGAAAFVLRDVFGDVAFIDDTHAGVRPARPFDNFDEAAEEAAVSRLYGGIHYRSACENGVDQGRCIGAIVTRSIEYHD
jgi:hypothetical protein